MEGVTGVPASDTSASYRRDIGWFGSFAMGYGDVGADVFIALGIVTLYAGGAAPLVFLVAALIYVSIGLAYAELAPAYPYAGGSQVYAMKASNTLVGFLAGWALMLDYTLCISLFAAAAAGYLKFLIPPLQGFSIPIPILGLEIQSIGLLGGLLVLFLILLNYFGVKYSAGFISLLVVFGLAIQAIILTLGYALAFNPERFLSQITVFGNNEVLSEVGYLPWLGIDTNNFLYGLTLAMASFIGIESIAQAAEETRKPQRWIPRAAKLSIVAVFLSVILFSVLSIGVLDWRVLGMSYENPVAQLVTRFPLVGASLATVVAFAAFILCYASSNTGVIGVSRLTASMGKFSLLPKWFYYIHPKYRTPTRTIVIFGLIGFAITLFGDIPFIASLYNFGALLSYMLLMLSLILLRNKEKEIYRPWKVPVTLRIKRKTGEVTEVPIIGLLGFIGTTIMWFLVVLLHTAGRTFGFIWMAVGLLLYIFSRHMLGKGILSREEGEMIKPMGYKMDVGVLVRPFEDFEVVKRSILHGLDKRFRIRLITVIDVEDLKEKRGKVTVEELEGIRESTEKDLMKLAKELKQLGYETVYCVHVGKFDNIIEKELESANIDMLVFIKRTTEKATIEKGHEAKIHNIMLKHPGKIMVLKRVK